MMPIPASVAVHTAAKDGNSAAEYEDAWSVVPVTRADEEVDARGWRCAVADGASESLLAGAWAGELVRGFTEAEGTADPADFAETARLVAERWPTVVADYIERRENAANPLKWYEKPGLDKGAHATLLTIEVSADGDQGDDRCAWTASALGDTCVFQVRDDRLMVAFPMVDSRAFTTSPGLVSSRGLDTEVLARHVGSCTGELRGGDDLYLGTDAFAAWFLARWEQGHRPWHVLCDLGLTVDFNDWLAHERAERRMRNDDVTLVHLNAW